MHRRPGASHKARRLGAAYKRQAAAASLVSVLFCQPVWAECFGEHIGRDGKYTELIYAEPQAAIVELQAAIVAAKPDPAQPNQLAELYTILANAYAWNNQPYRAADLIQKGLASLTDRNDLALEQRLKLMEAWILDSTGQSRLALERYERMASQVPRSAPYYICVLIDRAYLRVRNGRTGAALTDLLEANHMSRDSGNFLDRANIAISLGWLYASVDFYEEALYQSGIAISIYERIGRRGMLAEAYLDRALAQQAHGDSDNAGADYTTITTNCSRMRDFARCTGLRADWTKPCKPARLRRTWHEILMIRKAGNACV